MSSNSAGATAPKPTRDERDVSIAKKIFIAGCFFLPWLWILLLLRYRSRYFEADCPPALRSCESFVLHCLAHSIDPIAGDRYCLHSAPVLMFFNCRYALGFHRGRHRDRAAHLLDRNFSVLMAELGCGWSELAYLEAGSTVVELLSTGHLHGAATSSGSVHDRDPMPLLVLANPCTSCLALSSRAAHLIYFLEYCAKPSSLKLIGSTAAANRATAERIKPHFDELTQ